MRLFALLMLAVAAGTGCSTLCPTSTTTTAAILQPQAQIVSVAPVTAQLAAQPQIVQVPQISTAYVNTTPPTQMGLGIDWFQLPIPIPAIRTLTAVQTQTLTSQLVYPQAAQAQVCQCVSPQLAQVAQPPLAPAVAAPTTSELCQRLEAIKAMIEAQQKANGCGGK